MGKYDKYSKEFLLKLYENMVRIRKFEEAAADCFSKGMLPGNIHLGIGQEGGVAGALMALKPIDYMTPTHRGHGQVLCKGADSKIAMAELFGKKTGYCKGKGGSMHIVDTTTKNLGANGIVGGSLPLATGSAFASQILEDDAVTLCIFGDSATNQGTFHESINMAAAWKLPVVYLCENNGYGVSTHIYDVINTDNIAVRAKAYGIPGKTVDGENPVDVYEVVLDAVEKARSGEGPSLIEVLVYRWQGHYCGDPAAYRPKEYMEEAYRKDPIKCFARELEENKIASPKDLLEIDKKMEQEMQEALDFAVNSEYPEVEEAYKDVYSMDNERCVER